MTRDFLLKHIAEAERRVAEGRHLVQQHQESIARLRDSGSGTENAEQLLDILLGVQTAHQRHLVYLRGLLTK
jgi:hypothetical protein